MLFLFKKLKESVKKEVVPHPPILMHGGGGEGARQPIAVSDISVYICLINIRSKSKEQLNERRAGLSGLVFRYS